MYHSILIDGVSTWENQMEVDGEMKTVGYHLVPSKRPTIAPPPVRTEYVDIPGADSQLDYTEVMLFTVKGVLSYLKMRLSTCIKVV